MKNPSQQHAEIQKFKILHRIEVMRDPLLFKERQKKRKVEAPKAMPCFNQPTIHSDQAAEELRALLCYLSENSYSNFSSITSDDHPIILDSGASCCMSPFLDDFIDGTYRVQNGNIGGIASGLATEGVGQVNWTLSNTNNQNITLKLDCLYVPNLPCRLMCPQQLAKAKQISPHHFPNGAWIGGGKAAKVCYQGNIFLFPYDERSNLPTVKTALGTQKYCAFVSSTETDESNNNLTAPQKLLLKIHHRCGHRCMREIQDWAKSGKYNLPLSISKCEIPVCAACQFSEARKRNSGKGKIAKETKPGDFVSVDAMEAGSPGYIPFTRGRPSRRRYTSTNVWSDHSSKFIWCDHQEDKTAESALKSKVSFETFAARYNVDVKHIHSDNGIFDSKEFIKHCNKKKQKRTLCGVGAHHQNGSIERYIGLLSGKARTMLLHAMQHWKIITPEFWTFAFSYAKLLHNCTPRPGELETPFEKFTGEEPSIRPNDMRVFGCPVFVLSKEMQDGNATQKFCKKRSYLGVFVGFSDAHASSVPLVFNPRTKLVSPQYHVIFDEGFSTSITTEQDKNLQEKIFQSISLFGDHPEEWKYTDQFDSNPSRQFFDCSWDIDAIEEDFQTRAKEIKKTIARAKQKLGRLRATPKSKTLRDLEGDQNSSHASTSDEANDDVSACSGISTNTTSTQYSQGNISRHGYSWSRHKTKSTQRHKKKVSKRKRMKNSQQRLVEQSDHKRNKKVSFTDAMIDTNTTSNQEGENSTEVPSPIQEIGHNDTGDELPIHPINTHDECEDGSDSEPTSLPTIISQLAKSDTDTSFSKPLRFLASLFAESDEIEEEDCEIPLEKLVEILDSQHIIDDCVTPEGAYGDFIDPLAFQASKKGNNPDVLSRGQMMKAPDKDEFLKVEEPELKGLEDFGVFEYLKIANIPEARRHKLLNAIWSYRRKRRPDGSLLKYKSRICADGSQQKDGIDYFADQIYSPVVQWSTVRITLLLSKILGLMSRQIDFVQAFPQAPLNDDVYMRMPQGWTLNPETNKLMQHTDPKFRDSVNCIKLKRNLYGCKQASKNFYDHITAGLAAEGFQPSSVDPCLWMRHDIMLCLYVDDCTIFANNASTISSFVSNMRKRGYLLEDEGDIENFLGVNITKTPNGKYEMKQTGLIQDILNELGLNHAQAKYSKNTVPASEILHADLDQPEFSKSWNYRSLIGKLNFLALNSRPDIAFAVHQCARFCCNPRASHGAAVKRIGRYLKHTPDSGLIFDPKGDHSLHAFCDADFAGTWTSKCSAKRSSALSRTGFVILYSGCPILWHSKLQTEIALSTCEAEYIALSQCARVLIPLRRLLENISDIFKPTGSTTALCRGPSNFLSCLGQSVILEDNESCVRLALDNENKYSPRTRHISVKWHHFREQIQKKWLTVRKVATAENWADIFTKALARPQFEKLRNEMMGWKDANPMKTVLDHVRKDIDQERQPIREAYNPFESNSPYAVAALAKGEAKDSQTCNFDKKGTVKTEQVKRKLQKLQKSLKFKRRRFK